MVAKCSVVRAYTRLDVQRLYILTHPTHILKFHPYVKNRTAAEIDIMNIIIVLDSQTNL